MSKQRITKFDLSGFGDSTTSNTSSGVKKFDLSAFEKKKDGTELSGQVDSTAGSSEQAGNPRQFFGMSYADWGKKYGAIGEFAADIADVPVYFKNELYKGVLNGAINDEIRRADAANEKPDFDKIASLRKDINSVSLPKAVVDKINAEDDFVSSAVKNVGGTILSSLASSVGAYKSGAVGAVGGAIGGAAVGNIFAEVTAPIGAFAGYQAATSYANEFGGAVIQAMEEKGYDITDPKQIEKAYNDKALMEDAKQKGLERGLTVASIDLLTAGLAAKFGGKAAVNLAEKQFLKAGEEFTESATKKIVGATTTAIEAAGGSIGEATAQLVSEGKISDWDAVGMEAFAEVGGGAPSIAYNTYKAAQINNAANKENSAKIQSLQTTLEGLEEGDQSAEVIKSKISELKRENDERNNLVVETLDKSPVPVAKKVLELTNQIETFDQRLQEFKVLGESGTGLTDEQRQQQKTFQDIHSDLTRERQSILDELTQAREFEANINAPSPEQTSLNPFEIKKMEKAISAMTDFVGENLKQLVPSFTVEQNGDYTVSVGKEGKPNAESSVTFTKEEKQQRRELDSQLDEGTITPEEHSSKVQELNKQVVARGIEDKVKLITPAPQPSPATAPNKTEEFVYETAPENKKEWKGDFEVVDNRGGKAGLEQNGTDGRWYVRNKVTDRILPASTKNEALSLIENAFDNDFGQGETYTREVAPEQAPQAEQQNQQPSKGQSISTMDIPLPSLDENAQVIDNESNNKIKILKSAKAALQTLKSVLPNFDIVIHNDEASYNEEMKNVNGIEGSRGNFSYDQNEDGSYSGKIDINLTKANGRTVAHEVAHAILLRAFGDNPAVFKSFKDKLAKAVDGDTNKELSDFIKQYSEEASYEEYVTELTGILEQQEKSIAPTTIQKIASVINEVVSNLTNGAITVFQDTKDTKDIIDFMNTISESIRQGASVSEETISKIQETAGINSLGLSGNINAENATRSKSSISSGEIKRFPVNENASVRENVPLSEFNNKTVNLMESDRMIGGYIENTEGNPLYKFYGGVYFPIITGKWWASRNESKAKSIAESANKNRDADGYVYSAPMVGSDKQHMSNTDMLAVTVELMKSDANSRSSKVKKQDIIDSLNKAFDREGVKNKKPVLKNVLNKSNSITTLFNELEYILFQEGNNVLDNNGNPILGADKKPISNFSFEERKTIVETLLGDPKVKERRFPSAGSITETAKRFEEPITSKAENIGDLVTVMRTKGELKYKTTSPDDSFYHKSYPVEIYAVNPDGSPAKIEVAILDGAYAMKDVVPTLTQSSGKEFTWNDYLDKHKKETIAVAQYNRTAKLSSASGKISATKSKSQAIDKELSKASGTTQVATTVGSYAKAANILNGLNVGGRILDYGAGLGLGTDAMSDVLNKDVESYEINPERWKGRKEVNYTKSEDIKGMFDGIVSLNVLNVVPKDIRDFIVADIFAHLNENGTAVISSRKFAGDIDGAKNFELGDEPKSYIIKRKQDGKIIDVFQKGYDGNELVEYVKGILGDNATVEKNNSFGAAGVIITKTTGTKSKSQTSNPYKMDTMFDNPDEMFSHLADQLSDEKTAKEMGFVTKGYRNASEAIADNMITRSLAKGLGAGFGGIRKVGNATLVKVNTKDKNGNPISKELSLNSVWKDAIGYTEDTIKGLFIKAQNSNNVAAKELQHFTETFVTNLTTSEEFQKARRELFGGKNNSNNLLTQIGERMNNMIGNDTRALYRVHSLLDPEAFAKEPQEGLPKNVEDLSFNELRLFNYLRATNDFIHEWHYRNGFLDQNTYEKNKGKYFARTYRQIEEKQYGDIYEAIKKSKAGAEFNMFRKRKDFDKIHDSLSLSDPIYITIKRMGMMAHNKAIFDFAQKVSNDPNYKSYSKLSEVPEKNQKYYKKLNGNGNPKRFGDLTNKYVPLQIYEQLYGTQFVTEFMSRVDDISTKYDNMFLRQFTKKLKTVGSPLTRAANVISGYFFSMMGGVDPITLFTRKPDARKSLDTYDTWAQELSKAGLLGGQLSGLDIKKASKESQGLNIIRGVIGDKGAQAYETVDKLLSDTYGKVDDITKIAYYRTLVENYGLTKEEAIDMTAKQMQNYNTVPNGFKLAAKLPIIGNAFIKFKPDSMRILYNSFKERPIWGVMSVAMMAGLARAFSKASGESDEEREARENRPYTTKLKVGDLDVSFGWKIGNNEYNVARYLSPYSMYDKGYKGNLISDMSEYTPLQVQYLGKGTGVFGSGYMPKFSDPLSGPIAQAAFNIDNSGLRIDDPRASRFNSQTVSSKQRWFNSVNHVMRSWGTPYAAWAESMMDSFNEKSNYKGQINNPLNAMLSIAVKNEEINPDILVDKYSRYLNTMDYEVGDIINSWKAKEKKSLQEIDNTRYLYDTGKIKSEANKDARIKEIQDEYSDLAIELQGRMLEIVGESQEPQEMIKKLQELKAKTIKKK